MQIQTSSMYEQVEGIISSLMSHEGHLSYSSLSAFKSSPIDFINYKMGVKEQTDAMLYGSMLHCLVLEPGDFFNRYHLLDDLDICNQIGGAKPRATKVYKEWKQAALAEAGDKLLVEADDYTAAKIAANSILNNRASAKIINQATTREKPIEWEYKNFKFKGFIDGDGDKAIFDIKTMPNAAPKEVQREIVKRGLYIQAAMYLYGTGIPKDYYIIAVDRKGGISVHKLEMALIEQGMIEYSILLDHFNYCILTDSFDQSYDFWADRGDGIFMCEKPAYMY